MKLTSATILASLILIFATTLIDCTELPASPIKEDPVEKIVKAAIAIVESDKKITETSIKNEQKIIGDNIAKVKGILNEFNHWSFLDLRSFVVEYRMKTLAKIIAIDSTNTNEIHEKLVFWQKFYNSISTIVNFANPISEDTVIKPAFRQPKIITSKNIPRLTEFYNEYLRCFNIIKAEVKEMDLKAVINHLLEPVAKEVKFLSELRTAEETDGKLLFKKDFVDYAAKLAGEMKIIPGIEAKMDSIINLLFGENYLYPSSPVKDDAFEKMLRTLLDKDSSYKSSKIEDREIVNTKVFQEINNEVIKIQIEAETETAIVKDLIIRSKHYDARVNGVAKKCYELGAFHNKAKLYFEVWDTLNSILRAANFICEGQDETFFESFKTVESFGRIYHVYVNVLTKALGQIQSALGPIGRQKEIEFKDVFEVFLGPVLKEIKLIVQIYESVDYAILNQNGESWKNFLLSVKNHMKWTSSDMNLINERIFDNLIYECSITHRHW